MQLGTIEYFVYLVIIFLVYWRIQQNYRWILLLLASYGFCWTFGIQHLLTLILMTILSYILGLAIERKRGVNTKLQVIAGVILVLLPLCIFKYSAWIWKLDSSNLISPIGISFYTFQMISYIVDVYKGKIEAERNLGYYALFIAFFPKMLSGPIERGRELIPQLKREKVFSEKEAMEGVALILIGIYKKTVIANMLSKAVDIVFGNLSNYSGAILCITVIMLSIQIYADFSGYSDMAVGSAKVLGIQIENNFKSPFFSVSVHDFWNRWHISLSSWLRDYIYIPLGGNRKGVSRKYVNLMITFLISGLWHGANWTFVAWGGIHGAYLILEDIGERVLKRKIKGRIVGVLQIFQRVWTFVLISVAWIFFRADTFTDAVYILRNMFSGGGNIAVYLREAYQVPHAISKSGIVIIMSEFLILWLLDAIQYKKESIYNYLCAKNSVIKWSASILFVMIIIIFSVKNQMGEYIYAQF